MLQPLGSRVLVEPIESEASTPGGILLPEQARKKSHSGTVIAVGPGEVGKNGKRAEVPVKPGDVVVYPAYGGVELRQGERLLMLIDADALLAVES